MKKIILLLSLQFLVVSYSFSQEITKLDAKYYHRNKDFVERRFTPSTNYSFAKNYAKAVVQKQEMEKGIARKTDNTWLPLGPLNEENTSKRGRINSITFHPYDTSIFFVCVAQGGVWKTTNSGNSWIDISGDLPILRTSAIAVNPNDDDILYLATGDMAYIGHNLYANENKRNTHYGQGIYKSTNGGKSWKATGLSFKQTDFEESLICEVKIHPTNTDIVVAATTTGIYRTEDAGDTWTKTQDGLFWDLKQSPNAPLELFASTGYVSQYKMGNAGIFYSDDFGKTWTEAKVPFADTGEVQRIEIATSQSEKNTIYALATDNKSWSPGAGFYAIYKSTDNGANFSMLTSRSTLGANLLSGSLGNFDGGQGTYDLAFWVDDNDANVMHIGGVNLWTSNDGASSFQCSGYARFTGASNALHADVHQVKQHPTTNRYFVCTDGGLSSAKKIIGNTAAELNDGIWSTQWKSHVDNLNVTSFYRIGLHPTNKETILAGAQDNFTQLKIDDDWIALTGGDGMECEFDTLDHIYTSYQYGNFFQIGSFGGFYDILDFYSAPSNEIAEWTTPFALHEESLYIGYSQVHKQISFGIDEIISDFKAPTGWNSALPSSALYISPSNAQRLYVAKRGYQSFGLNSEVWATQNEGNSWTDISDGLPVDLYPTYLTASNKVTKNAWVSFAGFSDGEKIYSTTDFGKTWTNISYNLPNIPVNCIAFQDKNGTLYAGTDLGVFYLLKGATQWQVYGQALPNVIVTELKINQRENMLVASTFGRGVWYTELVEIVGNKEIEKTDFSIYPNPSTDALEVNMALDGAENLNVYLLDLMGRKIEVELHSNSKGGFSIDVSKLLPSQYFVVVENGKEKWAKQFLKVD